MKDIEKNKMNDETLDKVNGGRFKFDGAEQQVPYASYIGTTVYYNGVCTVLDIVATSSCPGVTEYSFKLQYQNGTVITVDRATFESIISGAVCV